MDSYESNNLSIKLMKSLLRFVFWLTATDPVIIAFALEIIGNIFLISLAQAISLSTFPNHFSGTLILSPNFSDRFLIY